MAKSERVYLMKSEFMKFHLLGFDIPEIAEKFGLAAVTVYKNLQDIANQNGVKREELLKAPHRPHKKRMAEEEEKEQLELEELRKEYANLKKSTEETLRKITNIIEQEEKDNGTSDYTER